MITPSSCSGCGAPFGSFLRQVEDNISDEYFSVARCSVCGLGHTTPLPEDLEPYYGERYYGNRHGFTAAYCVARRMRLVTKAMPAAAISASPKPAEAAPSPSPARRLLDVGCGEGTFLLEGRRRGWEVYGTEMNPAPARAAGLEVGDSIPGITAFAPFDCITLWHSLEHLRDPLNTLREMHAMLAPGGVLLVAVPDAGGLHARLLGRNWFPLDVPRHIHHLTKSSLTQMLKNSGFQVTGHAHQEIEYDLYSFNMSVLKIFMKRPADCFNFLIGRPRRVSRARMAMAVFFSAVLSPVTLAMTFLGSVMQRGGTLILTAKAMPTPSHQSR